MNDKINQIKNISKRFGSLNRWKVGSGKNAKVINNARKNDFIYEFWCFVKILEDLQYNYKLAYVPGKGDLVNCFAGSPANKRGRPYFIALDKHNHNIEFQICHGTKIIDKFGDERAPDISIQSSKSPVDQNPDYQFVKMIFDAKYKTKLNSCVTTSEFATFSMFIKNLDLVNRRSGIQFKRFDIRIKQNILLTNGRHSSEVSEARYQHNIVEVYAFAPSQKIKFES